MNTPNIRFKGFTEDWEKRKLGYVVEEFYNGQTPYRQNKIYWDGDINWLSSGDLNRGLITNTVEKITEEGKEASGLKLVPKGTLVIAIMGLEAAGTRGNCGILAIDTTINQACMALIVDSEQISSDFLFQWYKRFGNAYALKFTQGTKQQNYNAELLADLDISYPKIEEQTKIGEYFSRLDNLITLHQRKCDSLKQVKKYMLQKLFPKQGEKVPEIRFAGFTGDWEQRKLGEIVERITRKNTGMESTLPLTISAQYGLIDQNEFFDKRIASKDVSGYYLVYNGEFAYNKSTSSDAPWGAIKRLDRYEKGVLSTLYIVFTIKDNEKTDSDYLSTYYDSSLWHKEVQAIAAEGARNHGLLNISPSDFFETKLSIPSNIDEQRKIGAYFSNLDNLITLHQRKSDSLKQVKKYMLQNMFPQK